MNMKYIKVLGLAGLLSFSACGDFDDMNVDPNRPASVKAGYIMTNAQKTFMDNIWDQWGNGRFGMLYAQYWAQNQYTDESRYKLRDNVNNSMWITFYSGVLKDFDEVITLSTDEAYLKTISVQERQVVDQQALVARIMKVYVYQVLTDIYGHVPYAQALNDEKYLSPAYSHQKEIYEGLIAEINAIIPEINESAVAFASGDMIYDGNMLYWKKFANSIKMRLAIRMADKNEAQALQLIDQAVASGVISSNAENAYFHYLAAPPANNPLNEDRKTRADFAVSNTLIDALTLVKAGGVVTYDPRIEFYAAKTVNSDKYIGMPYGMTNAQSAKISNDAVSQPSRYVLEATAPGILFNYAEVLFIQAEAAQRKGQSTVAEDLFKQGIKASMREWGVSQTVADAYVAANITYNPAKWRNDIGKQKWLALYMQGIQGWAEFRRLDFEGVFYKPYAGSLRTPNDAVPTRYLYPTDEQTLNLKSYKAALGMPDQGADRQDTKLWWDVNAAPELKTADEWVF